MRSPARSAEFFAEVLILCARLGMGRLGNVALDGMKIAASASKSANKTEQTLRKMAAETVAAHGRADVAEDDLFGEGRAGTQHLATLRPEPGNLRATDKHSRPGR